MNKPKLQTIVVLSENKPGVLYRIAGIFLRRKINVEHLEVHALTKHEARFTIEIYATNDLVQKLANQITKIVEVKDTQIS